MLPKRLNELKNMLEKNSEKENLTTSQKELLKELYEINKLMLEKSIFTESYDQFERALAGPRNSCPVCGRSL